MLGFADEELWTKQEKH